MTTITNYLSKTQRRTRSMSRGLFVLMLLLGFLFSNQETRAMTGSGTSSDPYVIHNSADFASMRTNIQSGSYDNKYWKLGASFTTSTWMIGYDRRFSGTFDGNGHTITLSNVASNYAEYCGLFARTENAVIKNLGVTYSSTINTWHNSAGLIGYARGTLTVENVKINAVNKFNFNGVGCGGLIGLLDPSGTVSISRCSLHVGTVYLKDVPSVGYFRVGGIIGHARGGGSLVMKDCHLYGYSFYFTDSNGNPKDYYDYAVGGIIGKLECPVTMSRCVGDISIPYSGQYGRGGVIGEPFNNTYLYDVFYSASSALGASVQGNYRLGYNSMSTTPLTQDNYNIWYYLERRDDSSNAISSNKRGNEFWDFGGTAVYTDPLATDNYATRVEKGAGILSFSGAYVTDTYSYSGADHSRLVRADAPNLNEHQRVDFTFSPNYQPSKGATHTVTQKRDTLYLTARVDGTISAKVINIPYPINLTGAFDQWNNKLTLSWIANNSNNLSGKFQIYKRLKEDTGDWTLIAGPTLNTSTGSTSYSQTVNTTSSDWDKDWDYVVAFIEGTGTVAPSTPPTEHSSNVQITTAISITISSFRATGQEDGIKITAIVPTQLVSNSSYGYKIYRSMNGKEFVELASTRRFDGSGKVEYTDEGIYSSCNAYTYRLEIEAFNKIFYSTEATANVTGSTQLGAINVSKGEYSNQVRVAWDAVKATTDVTDRYKIFRKVATNADNEWTEIATINTNELSYIYSDDKAMPGVYYRYKVVLYQVCGMDMTELESKEDIGFSQSLGTVSGRITYGTGISVKNVSVSVIRNDLQTNESQYRSLLSSGEGGFFSWSPTAEYYNKIINRDFTYQFWLNPQSGMTGVVKVGELANFGTIYLVAANDNYYQVRVVYQNASSSPITLTTTEGIAANRFAHITIVRTGTSIKICLVNDERLENIQLQETSNTGGFYTVTSTASPGIRMGYAYKGNIDEIRLWSRALTADEILKDHNRMLIGSEENLKAYWTFDEGIDSQNGEEGYFFDISRVGTVFNRNHGRHTLSSSPVVPSRDQLALKAITDNNGNYQIRGIPFSGEGTSYDIVPTLGVHQFNPTSQLRYISNSSLVHNATDFTDISSFDLSGYVLYEGGTFPVTGCNFEIDGVIQTNPNGSAITNNGDGSFKISVPIGEHTVRVVKTGHTFANDGYLTMPEGGYNKNESERYFYDQTRVKLIGRVVGGLTEYDKPLGFGESVNNTGVATITLNTASNRQQYKLQSEPKTEVFNHNEGQWKKPEGRRDDQTTVTYNPTNIKIDISAETGEFVAWVYPEVYDIATITAYGYAENIYDKNESLDLSSVAVPNEDMMQTSIRTWPDSVLVSRPGQVDYYEKIEKSDSIRYHAEWSTYYQSTPTFSVNQLSGYGEAAHFGENYYTIEDALTGSFETIDLWNGSEYLFGAPVFKQGNKYTFAFEAYEEYVNVVSERAYRYPVNQGTVNMSNTIAFNESGGIALNESGKATYTFIAGAPDLTTGRSSFMGTITIGTISYYWNRGSDPIEVWHLGDKTTGTDFMTTGPDQITAILRDPPGSLSYSYIEEGTSITTTATSVISDGMRENMNLITSLGPKVTTFVGLGAGVITTTETKIDVSGGLNSEQTWSSSTETSTTTTFTERFQTSSDPLYVGHNGDVFIGNSTNIQYGLTNGISIQKNYLGDDEFTSEGEYSIAKSVSLAYGQTFDTRFAYTQIELEEIMIPKWQDNLALLLLPMGTTPNEGSIPRPVYVSNLPHDDNNFGKLNTDKEAFGANASTADKFHDGPSYTIYFPTNYELANFNQDSVMFYNNQINGWVELLAQNEKEKAEMEKLGNYSFGAGASIEWSKTESSSKTTSSTFHWVVNPTIGYVTGADVMGIGMELETTLEYVAEGDDSSSETKETTITSGFVLQEEGDDDEITLDYGMTASGTIAFKSRGGRTSCPYEDAYVSKYYQAGQHVLSEATMQIEVPKIDVNGSDQVLNVPANKTAKFTLDLKNESETGEDVWFQLIVDDSTNPHGAELKIDGGVIGNGRVFLVKAGEVLKKTLTVGKGTADTYEKIALILRSECQSDPTDFLPVIADTTYVSVEFIPACTEVNIKEPSNNWIVYTENSDVLRIVLDQFDRNFPNFGYIQLQARKTTEANWRTLTSFYADEMIYSKATGNKEMINPFESTIIYNWDMSNETDGEYELRAVATSVNTDNEGAIIDVLSSYTSDVMLGVKDMTRPEPLGLPSPVNGIMTASDEISITFNENIQTGMLTKNNFKIMGLLNQSEIAEPNTGLYFTGGGMASTELPIVANGSFSIQMWFKRENNKSGTLFTYRQDSEYIALIIDSKGYVGVNIGGEIQTSTKPISNTTNTWKYIGLSYDRDNKTVSVYAFQDSDPVINLFVETPFPDEVPTQGKLHIGGSGYSADFNGAIGLVHFYNAVQTASEMSLSKSVNKSGDEPNLIGLWELNEAEGTVAKDKARNRNMIVDTDWYIYPSGHSLSMSGNGHAILPSSTFPFRYYDDFSIELQFKGATPEEATLLSIGTNIHLGFDNELNLVLTVGETTQLLSDADLLDNKWHHLALSVKRSGTTTVVIDGVAVTSFSSSIFSGDVGGGYYYLGVRCKENKVSGNYDYTQYFKGNMDEIRVWNIALSTSAIKQNKNHKLRGDEKGLLSYYPFETWEKLSDGTTLVKYSSKDFVDNSRSLGGYLTTGNTGAPVVDAPVMTEIRNNYTFTASDNKIVFNITEELYRIEGVTLQISAEDVLDMRGNKSNLTIWDAYINKNPLIWLTDDVNIVMEQGSSSSFQATIQNHAGVPTDYYIDNLPNWLSVDNSSGTLQPLAKKELTFLISESINIGGYEANVVLKGINNVQKFLPVSLNVTGERPDWEFNPKDFEQTMTMTGQVRINNYPQEDENDVLAAFIDDRCVGLASPRYEPSYNTYFVYMMIGGNSEDNNKDVTFKLWDASTGQIYPSIYLTNTGNSLQKMTFVGDDSYGTPDSPIRVHATNIVEQSIALNKGWNWMSINVANSNPALIDQFKTNTADYATQIKAGDGSFLNNVNEEWAGLITSLSNDQMYAVKSSQANILKIIGNPIKSTETPITLSAEKWSWIGYTPQYILSVADALAGISEPVINDQIKGQKGYRMMSSKGWLGSLVSMEPGMGYKYKSGNSKDTQFVYPSASSIMKSPYLEKASDYAARWETDYIQYPYNMTVTTSIQIDGQKINDGLFEIAAFSGNECRGSVIMEYIDGFEYPFMGFLMVYGEKNETIHFRIYDHSTGKEYKASEMLNFQSDAIHGTPDNLFVLSSQAPTGTENIEDNQIAIFPNPVENDLFIRHNLGTLERVEILDITGKLLWLQEDFIDSSINVSEFSKGTFFIHISADGQKFVNKFIKK